MQPVPVVIVRFHLQYEFLSNFYPCTVTYDGQEYPSAEHAYQAAKTTDESWRGIVRNATSPAKAKRLGYDVPLRSDWDEIKVGVMSQIIQLKFDNVNLKRLLLDTGESTLIEGNTWGDSFWGVDLNTGIGRNQLGTILMKVRESIQTNDGN